MPQQIISMNDYECSWKIIPVPIFAQHLEGIAKLRDSIEK